MKIIKIELESCERCKNNRVQFNDSFSWINRCVDTGKEIPDITTIPDWCKLEDAPKKERFMCPDCGTMLAFREEDKK